MITYYDSGINWYVVITIQSSLIVPFITILCTIWWKKIKKDTKMLQAWRKKFWFIHKSKQLLPENPDDTDYRLLMRQQNFTEDCLTLLKWWSEVSAAPHSAPTASAQRSESPHTEAGQLWCTEAGALRTFQKRQECENVVQLPQVGLWHKNIAYLLQVIKYLWT